MAEVVHRECEGVGVGRGRDIAGEQRHAATPRRLQSENMSCRRNRGEQVDRESVGPSDESACYRYRYAVEPLLREEANRRSTRAAGQRRPSRPLVIAMAGLGSDPLDDELARPFGSQVSRGIFGGHRGQSGF